MTDDYNLAKPDPNLRDNEVMMGAGLLDRGERIEEARQRVDASGFLAGEDRMKTAPELLEENKALRTELAETFRKAVILDRNRDEIVHENERLRAQVKKLLEAVQTAVGPEEVTKDVRDERIEIYPGAKQGGSDRSRLVGLLMQQKGILEIQSEDGTRWIAGVTMTNLKTAHPSKTRPREILPTDRLVGIRIIDGW
jgi:hypothetical protein